MKKIFTLLSVMMLFFVLGANAQDRKTWDFTKGVSDESRALLDADAAQWTKSVNSEGVSTGWVNIANPNGPLMAKGQVLKELTGLSFNCPGDSKGQNQNGVNYLVTKLRLQKGTELTISGLKANQKIAIKAQSANATATNRGFKFDNATIVEGNEGGIVLGRDAEGAPEGGVTNFLLNVTADGAVVLSTGINGAPEAGVEILSIIIDEGDKNIKTWDFTAWSEATQTQVCGAEDWTAKESATKDYLNGGNQIRWIDAPAFDANNDLTAGGAAIKELKGLRHEGLAQYGMALAFDYQNLLDGNQDKGWGPFNGPKYLWVMGNASKIIIPNVKLGSTLKLGVETHKLLPAGTSEARGFKLIVGGVEVTAQTTDAYKVIEYTIPTEGVADEDGDGYADVALVATKGCHLYSIEAEVKDETVVDKNPRIGKPKFVGLPSGKVSPTSATGFTMSFPNYANIEPSTEISIEGYFGPKDGEFEDYAFDGVGGTVNDGIEFTFADYVELEENTEYEFYITKLTVAGYEKLNEEAAEGEKLYGFTFETSGPGIEEARSWAFHNDADMAAALQTSVDDATGYWAASSKGRFSYAKPITHDQLMLDAETPYPNTAGLYFTMGTANDILVGTPAGNNDKLQLGGGTPSITIPSCSEGDQIIIKALWSTKNSGVITITNGTYEVDGTNVINLTGSSADYVIKVTSNDDVVLASKNVIYQAISVTPAKDLEGTAKYTVVAKDPEGNVLKTYLEETEYKKNTKVEGSFNYWLKGSDDMLYTSGAKGSPFTWSVVSTEDIVHAVNYKKSSIEGLKKVVFCSEMEDIEGTTPCDHANMPIRSSNQKAAYNETDIELVTLQPGTYKIRTVLFDANSTPGVTATFAIGEDVKELVCAAVNFDEKETEVINVETATPVILKATAGDDKKGIDCILIYEYDETLGIGNVAVSASKTGVIKVVENGQFLIKTAKGTFSATGAQVK